MTDRSRKSRPANRKPNRAQRRAQEVRLAETNAPAPSELIVVTEEVEESIEIPTTPTASTARSRRRNYRPKTQPVAYTIPRQVEYAYIHSDLKRLLLTAAVLLVAMFALLFLLD